jgi:hypothetical protein
MSTTHLRKGGSRGQIALGKRYAGHEAMVEELEPGVWIVRFVPDNEGWLREPKAAAALEEASHWAELHPPQEANLAELAREIG